MSNLQVDSISNAAGTGYPTFTYGLLNSKPIAASAHETVAHAISSTAPVNFDTVDFDPYSMITIGASWHVTIPVTGAYLISCGLQIGAVDSINIYVNGVAKRQITYTTGNVGVAGTTFLNLTAGDLIDIRSGGAQTTVGSATDCYFNIVKL